MQVKSDTAKPKKALTVCIIDGLYYIIKTRILVM